MRRVRAGARQQLGEAVTLFDVACHNGGALRHVESGIRAAEQASSPLMRAELQVLRGGILLLRGRADEAESLLMRFGPDLRFGEPLLAPWVDISEAMLHLHRGDLEAAHRFSSQASQPRAAAQSIA